MVLKIVTALLWASMAGMGSAQLKNKIYKETVNTNEVTNEIRN